jgi:INO80 complex subunit C
MGLWTYVFYTQTLPEQLSFMHIPKPFKNPAYTKNATRRTQTLKTLLSREKERDKAVRAARNKTKNDIDGGGEVKMEIEGATESAANTMDGEDKMDIDATGERRPVVQLQLDEDELAEGIDPDDIPSCAFESIGST